jgi:hypothetical protein
LVGLAELLVEPPQVRPSSSTVGQFDLSFLTERIAQAACTVALLALHLDVRHFPRGPKFVEPKLVSAVRLPTVYELHPWEVVQMALVTGDQEPGGDHRGRLARLVADPVHVAAAILPIGVKLQLEKAGLDWSQEATVRAEKPSGERRNRHAHVGCIVERVGLVTRGLLCDRRRQ